MKIVNDIIAAVSTPVGESGIGIVRLSGPGALAIADKIFVAKSGKRPSRSGSHAVSYGHIVKNLKFKIKDLKLNNQLRNMYDDIVDEVLVTVMRAPRTYTKEDTVEINCHGGIQAVKNVLDLAISSGARLAEPGEFTKRAFLSGRIDLAQAEAVLDVIRARTEGSLAAALDQLEGGLSLQVDNIFKDVVSMTSEVEASLDFPEEDIATEEKKKFSGRAKKIIKELKALVDTYSDGAILREGVLAIICGKPNVGKSSLMNLLLKRDRVIVSPMPGTTRDAVEEMISLKGVPIRLVDTAGISRTSHRLSIQGIAKSKSYMRLADIAILVLDASGKIDKHDLDIIKLLRNKKKIVVINKIDLSNKIDLDRLTGLLDGAAVVRVSVSKKRNIAMMEKAILGSVWSGGFVQGEGAMVTSARHKELLDKALAGMLSVDKALSAEEPPETIAIDLKESMRYLGLILGRSVSEDVLDRIFEKFCIGK